MNAYGRGLLAAAFGWVVLAFAGLMGPVFLGQALGLLNSLWMLPLGVLAGSMLIGCGARAGWLLFETLDKAVDHE